MRLPSTKAVSSFILIFLFTGCGIHQELMRTKQAVEPAEQTQPDWYNADIRTLPIINNPAALAETARELSSWSAPFGQKVYAMRLATVAAGIDKKTRSYAVLLSRISYLVADTIDEVDEDKVKKCAEIGVMAARQAGVNKENPEACYYFALNQGLILYKKGLFGLNKLPEIFEALKIAQKTEGLDQGGPLRVLGMLYLKAPAWPSGIGDLDKSLELLEKAVKKYPSHPQNFMFYAQALIEDDNKTKALANLDIAYKLATPEIWGMYYSKKWRTEIDTLTKKISE
jgi:tetratricopeptide (TPR) repeat protein